MIAAGRTAPDWLGTDALAILLGAKSYALAEQSSHVETHHLLRACMQCIPDLVIASLGQVGCDREEAEAWIARVSAPAFRADAPGVTLPLSEGSNAIMARARECAGGSPVTVSHIWESLCATLPQLGDWLAERGWDLERVHRLATTVPGGTGRAMAEAERKQLAELCRRNLTELASAGRLSPAHGMEAVNEQLVRCLLRHGRRSAVLTGPAGVGKTKVVEDLALRIVQGSIPELVGCEVFELDLTLLTRGTHLAGSRAERWAKLTEILGAHAEHIILFVDELHTIVGMPIEGGVMDLANVMKPLLADGRVRIIGATTLIEYRKHIEGDPALARRFSEVRVPEPDREGMLDILRNVAPEYERFHGVRYPEEALVEVYERAAGGLPNQTFPAKGIDLLDEVGVHVKRSSPAAGPGVRTVVGRHDVRVVLGRLGEVEPEAPTTMDLAAALERKVVGQERAVEILADRVLLGSHGYGRHGRRGPRSVLLFVGPPGVGKSYMGRVLSEALFPGRGCLLTLDMAEFGGGRNGEHALWRLLGPPPPYSGWENGGLLPNHVRRHPASVVIVDELEKASPEAMNVLLRAFDEGEVQDGRGQLVSFRSTYFVLTSNAGVPCAGETRAMGFAHPDSRGWDKAGCDDTEERARAWLLTGGFPPEILSRISDVVLFDPLTPVYLQEIARRMLARLREEARCEDGVEVQCDDAALARWLVAQAGEKTDARRVAAAFNSKVEVPLARWRIGRAATSAGAVLRLKLADGRIDVIAVPAQARDAQQALTEARALAVTMPAR